MPAKPFFVDISQRERESSRNQVVLPQFIKKGVSVAHAAPKGTSTTAKSCNQYLRPSRSSLDQDVRLLLHGGSLDRGEADLLVAVVENGVVLAHEHVAKNPHLAEIGGSSIGMNANKHWPWNWRT